jgi:hypothetical protein
MLVKPDGLDRDFFAPVGALPNFAETTPGHDALGTVDFVSDNQLRRQHSPVCAQPLYLVSQIMSQGIRDLLF